MKVKVGIMKLKSTPKVFQKYKSDYPENTIKRIKEGFKEIGLNIIYQEKKIGTDEFSIYVSSAMVDLLSWSQLGKGITPILSKASAYAELAERFSTGFMELKMPLPKNSYKYQKLLEPINERKFLKGFTKVKNHEIFSYENISKYFPSGLSKKEYNTFKKENLLECLVDSYSILKKSWEKIPITIVELNSMSNGIASGNTYEEAITQASFEIFERYGANKIVAEKLLCPTIDPNTIYNKMVQKAISLFKNLNIDVIIKDFTIGNKIPVIGMVFINHNLKNDKNLLKKERDYIRIEVGSHLDLHEAIIRCFTENLQVLGVDKELFNREQSDILYDSWTKDLDKEFIGVQDEFKYFMREYDYFGDLSFLEKGKVISFDKLTIHKQNSDFIDDIKEITRVCISNSWDFSIIDFTHKILKFPTIRVVMTPISMDYDHFNRKVLKNKDFESRVNAFYGIKDFLKYLRSDKWIKNKEQIRQLIKNFEGYLSKELAYYYFPVCRENNFFQIINVLHIMPFLHMAVDEYDVAKKYFEMLAKLDFHPPFDSSFYQSLYLTKYSPSIYKAYVDLINRKDSKELTFDFSLPSNPLDADICIDDLDKLNYLALKNIADSYS